MTDWSAVTQSLRTWWRGATPRSQRPPALFPVGPSTPPVPTEYLSLYTYLEHRYASIVVLTFEQIDALLGFALPTLARSERAWWADTVGSQGHSAAWTAAGRTAAPNLGAGTIAFERPV